MMTVTRGVAGATTSLVLSLSLLSASGCDRSGSEEARRQAREVKVRNVQLEKNLADAGLEIRNLRAELQAVGQSRDELQETIAELVEQRDEALTAAQQAQDLVRQVTARVSGQVGATATLEKQVADLKALVAEQQAIIEELHKDVTGPPAAGKPPAEVNEPILPPPEPNEGL